MARNAQKMISRMFFIVGYFPHLGGVENFHTIYFFFEGFPYLQLEKKLYTFFKKCILHPYGKVQYENISVNQILLFRSSLITKEQNYFKD